MIGRPDATVHELLRVAKLTGVDAIAAGSPMGYNMPIGENGDGLSGGQRQLVALARSLIARPSLLLMDEPTSAMDTQTEAAFIADLAQATEGQTLVVVTHRPSLLQLVDRIIVVDAGKIAADGPKDEVLAALRNPGAAAQAVQPAHPVRSPHPAAPSHAPATTASTASTVPAARRSDGERAMNFLQKLRKSIGSPAPAAKQIHPADLAYMNDLRESQLAQSIPGTTAVLYLLAAIIVAGLVWAKFARVEEITQGEGKVIPVSREQIIQSLEGGIMADMRVQEGDVVEKGQLLLNIDPKRADSAYAEGYSKLIGLRGTVARLRAEAYGQPLSFPSDVLADKTVVQSETLAYQSRRKALQDSVVSLQHSYDLAMNEINMTEPLVEARPDLRNRSAAHEAQRQ